MERVSISIVQIGFRDRERPYRHPMVDLGRALVQLDSTLSIVTLDPRDERRFEWALKADVLWLYQSHDLDLLEVIEKRRARGLKTVAEVRERYDAYELLSPQGDEWRSLRKTAAADLILSRVDLIVVETKALLEFCRLRSDKPIELISSSVLERRSSVGNNYQWKEYSARTPEGSTIVGVYASERDVSSLFWLLPYLRELVGRHPALTIALGGFEAARFAVDLPQDRYIFDACLTEEATERFLRKVGLVIQGPSRDPFQKSLSDRSVVEWIHQGLDVLVPDEERFACLRPYGIPMYPQGDDLMEKVSAWLRQPREREGREPFGFGKLIDYVNLSRSEGPLKARIEIIQKLSGSVNRANSSLGFEAGSFEWELQNISEPSVQSFRVVSDLVRAGKIGQAIQEGLAFLDSNRDSLDVMFRVMSLSAAHDRKLFRLLLSRAQRDYPNDWRTLAFTFDALDDNGHMSSLEKLLQDIERRIVEAPVIQHVLLGHLFAPRMAERLKRNAALWPALLRFEELFEPVGLFHIELARAADLRGQRSESARLWKKVLHAAKCVRANREILENLPVKELEAMTQAYEGA